MRRRVFDSARGGASKRTPIPYTIRVSLFTNANPRSLALPRVSPYSSTYAYTPPPFLSKPPPKPPLISAKRLRTRLTW
eukprot:3233182-Rhodomonas_salina.1